VRHRYALQRAGSWLLDTRGPSGTIAIANLEGGAVTLVSRESGRETVFAGNVGEIDAQTSPDGGEVWSVNYQTGDLTVFDSHTGSVVNRQHAGAGASRIMFTRNGELALVVLGGAGRLVAYDVRSKTKRAELDVGADPKVIALSSDGRRAYITHPTGALTLVDVPSLTVLHAVRLDGTPDGVAVAR
jgi:DNA-binding beta-propeller fold protein YncE